ncbi:Hsp20/alpha crystallin family protein [Pedobacter sp. FW305-3-2-15-E-R2A2]|uniref:Hsp20/alpha crystallin family protein n=1 Tax=Pedobacter sp. FW305-3-2-15-E-R2A2 TaxID=3140251 RepID=UPI00313FFCE7
MSLIKFNENKRNSLTNGFNDIFESVFNDSFFSDRLMSKIPAVNISETENDYHIEMAAPGLNKQDFDIKLDRNILSVSVEQRNQEVQGNRQYSRKEFSYTSFVRSFSLPESADDAKIEANYTDGVLQIQVAKKEEAKQVTRRIEIS